jgi:hypothetical protein
MCDVEALLLALKLASGHLHKSDDGLGIHIVHAVYIPPKPPSRQLRDEADAMDKRDSDIQSIRDLLVKCEPKKKTETYTVIGNGGGGAIGTLEGHDVTCSDGICSLTIK